MVRITHLKVSGKPLGSDPTRIYGADWDEDHVIDGLTKEDVGLGHVDNTSDAEKNAATATLTNKTLTSPIIDSPTGITKANVGLGNVDNTSDATKNSAAATLTNKTISGANNTLAVREADLSTSDVTTADVSTSKHGFAPKLPNDATKYLNGTGIWSVPPGSNVLPALVPYVSDMHWDATRGHGWATAQAGGELTYTLSSAAVAGSTTITLTGAVPVANELLVFSANDGDYYSAAAASVSGQVVTLWTPIPSDVAAGANCHPFWLEEPHPTTYGSRAIVAYAVRNGLNRWRQVYKNQGTVLGTSTVTSSGSDFITYPGSSTVLGNTVTPTAASSGIQWADWRPRRTGRYRATLKVNGGAGGSLTFEVSVNGSTMYQTIFIDAGVGLHSFDFSTSNLGPVVFKLYRSATQFFVSKLTVYEHTGDVFAGFETGRHAVVADSWGINNGFGVVGALEERFPNATFINLSVGGDTAEDIWTRFDADVGGEIAANGPIDSALIIVGTNDYYGGTTPEIFGNYLSAIVSKALTYKTCPIVFTSSVGSAQSSASRFNLSRRYTDEVAYYDQEYPSPIFSADKNSTGQTGVASATNTQVTWLRETYDEGGYFASNAWTPPAGNVTLVASVLATGTINSAGINAVKIYKNGSLLKQNYMMATSTFTAGNVVAHDRANGSDVYSVYVSVTTSSGTVTIDGTTGVSYFSGTWSPL